MKATTHVARFLATGGAHLMTHDLFLAAQKTESEKEIEALEKVKKKRLAAMKIKQAAEQNCCGVGHTTSFVQSIFGKDVEAGEGFEADGGVYIESGNGGS